MKRLVTYVFAMLLTGLAFAQGGAGSKGIPDPVNRATADLSFTQGKHSAVNATYSLAPLDKDNCTYAVLTINHATEMVGILGSRATVTEEAARGPHKPAQVDSFVQMIADAEYQAGLNFGASALGAMAHRTDTPSPKSAKLSIAAEQMTFAYILELRGCVLTPGDVKLASK